MLHQGADDLRVSVHDLWAMLPSMSPSVARLASRRRLFLPGVLDCVSLPLLERCNTILKRGALGITVGDSLGAAVGVSDGRALGSSVGRSEGVILGLFEGRCVGVVDGASEGRAEG